MDSAVPQTSSSPRRLLFVCLGNICRSPALEAVMRHLLEEKGVKDSIEVDSCALKDFFVGSRPDPQIVEAAAKRGISVEGRARVFKPDDIEYFDYIFVVDKHLLEVLKSFGKTQKTASKVLLATQFAERYPFLDMPDPYCGGEEGFQLTLDIAEDACRGIIKEFNL